MNIQQSEILELVHRHFPQLAERALQDEIAEGGQLFHYQAEEVIMDFESYVKMVPLIVDGSIKVTREDERDGKEMILYFLGPGETCSMSFTCCMMNKKSQIRTQAVEDTTLIGIPIRYMDAWMSRYQSWKNFVMQSYDAKMMELVRVLDSVAFEDMDRRLQKYLRARAKSIGTRELQVTHQEIASDLNASREAISRLLKKLENIGEVELGRNRIKLLSE